MREQIGACVGVLVLLSGTPFLIWLTGDGSVGQALLLTLIPLF